MNTEYSGCTDDTEHILNMLTVVVILVICICAGFQKFVLLVKFLGLFGPGSEKIKRQGYQTRAGSNQTREKTQDSRTVGQNVAGSSA